MRTTITLDSHLAEKLKKQAAKSGTTVSRLIEDAVRIMLNRPSPSDTPVEFKLATFGKGARFSRYNIDKVAGLLAAEDRERYGPNDS